MKDSTSRYQFFVFCIIISLAFIFPGIASAQTTISDIYNPDPQLLNKFLLKEVNELRKKEKVEPLSNNTALYAAANDQSEYMLRKEKVTHFQRFNKQKHSPKNRVDYYGRQFPVVGENCQQTTMRIGANPNDKKNPPITTYEKLAEELVTNWKNSPGHYANMISSDFENTYVSVSVNADGIVYACQVFGGAMYVQKYGENQKDTLEYKPERPWRCAFCKSRIPIGTVVVAEDSSIYFQFSTGFRLPRWSKSRMRFFNPWNDGLAANIVLKSQYPCDSSNYFNGRRAVRGIPLPPVYKKNYFVGMFNTSVYLGKVPSYIKEDFEVNLTVIKNKRTCSEVIYNVIPSKYYVEIPLTFGVEPKELLEEDFVLDSISTIFFFKKGKVEPIDSSGLNLVREFLALNKEKIDKITLEGYASIEGTLEHNTLLYSNRTKYLSDLLVANGISASKINSKMTENFEDFREDIIGTEFEYLGKLSDSEIRAALKQNGLAERMESILAQHRYVQLLMTTRDTVDLIVTKEMVELMFRQAIDNKKARYAAQLQRAQYNFILKGEMTLDELDETEIPLIKRNKLLLHDRAVIHFLLDTLNDNRFLDLENNLKLVKDVDSTFKRVRTSLAIIEYYRWERGELRLSKKKYFKKLKKLKFVDKTIQSRIILNFGTRADWFEPRRSRRFINKVKPYIGSVRLNADKAFELASYYSYFHQDKYAYNLVKGRIDETENPEDLVYFLKLISQEEVNLPHDKYISYFKKVLRYSGSEFCTFFNYPYLNFQILDDPDIKVIYCKECSGIIKTDTRETGYQNFMKD